MKSIRELYRIGTGPSSSHTMGPRKAAEMFMARNKGAKGFEVTLYGSLAATGKGHMTDVAITDVLSEADVPVNIKWEPDIFLPYHPNGMKFAALNSAGMPEEEWTVYSVGGGALEYEGMDYSEGRGEIYNMNSMTEIMNYCERTGHTYWEYVEHCEGKDIYDFLHEIWEAMKAAVERGINRDGRLPGPLNLKRKALNYYVKAGGYRDNLKSRGLVFAYALAVSEENASGGVIVTAPTCGSCGVVPGVLYHLWKSRNFPEEQILHALATAGLVGNVVKHNASISGADVGCQGEVGVACAMAAAAASQLFGGSPAQIEYAAEMGLEHHLGMTCDPVCGLVQIPCIERNAVAAMRAMNACNLSYFLTGSRNISYDMVCRAMKETGVNLDHRFRETSEGGLAKLYSRKR